MRQCLRCAFKHLSVSMTLFGEICNGYEHDAEHWGELLGNLGCAEQHLFLAQTELAYSVRADRQKLSEFFFTHSGEAPDASFCPDFPGYLSVLQELIFSEEASDSSA
jgi:hypothetical protein